MKTKSKTAKSTKPSARKLFIITGLVVAGILVLAQAAFDSYLLLRQRQTVGDSAITHLIVSAIDGLQRPAAIDGLTGKVYIPEAKLVLPPPSDGVWELRYSYDDFDKPVELRVTTDGILHSAEAKLWVAQSNSHGNPTAVFRKVPNLQACARGVLASFGPTKQDTKDLTTFGQVKLADGRQMYLYTEDNCDANLGAVAAYLKQAQSY